MNKDSEQSDVYLFLKETAKEYIEKHDNRFKEFIDEYEADEMDYIKKEMEYFENTLYDVQNSESSHDGYSLTGFNNFSLAYELVNNIGPEKFLYSTKAKLKFLENKISVNPLNGLGGQTPLPENKRTQSSFLTNRQMEDNKTFHTHINIRGYEEDYNTKKMVFLMNNPEKTEKNFIENTIMEINSQNLEWERKCNLTEDEVYNECKNNKRYIDSVENGFDKEKYLEPLLKELAYAFKRRYNKEGITNKPSTKSIFYKTKLKNLQVPETINNEEQEEKTPYKIALLKELGFFDLDKIKNTSKENRYTIIQKLIGGTLRTVKGNVLVLNPESKEDRLKYTANNHLDKVKDYLDKLK